MAGQIALQNDSAVHLIHVRQAIVVPMGGVVTNPPLADAAVRTRLRTLAAEHLDGVGHCELVNTGDPAKVLLKTANQLKADLIVIGTHGRGGISRFLLGSVAEKDSSQSPMPSSHRQREVASRSRRLAGRLGENGYEREHIH